MLIIPAIDLRAGRCVRLLKGDYGRETVYDVSPIEAARSWQDQGAEWLHVVDLDGARRGEFTHWKELKDILAAVTVNVQVGGGVGDGGTLERLFDMGVARAVVGSAALSRPGLFLVWKERFGDKIIVSVDAAGERVKVRGWTEDGLELGRIFALLKEMKVRKIIFTDIERDGTLAGVRLEKIRAVAAHGFGVIFAGGVAGAADIEALAGVPAVEAVIVGKALLEGRIKISRKGDRMCLPKE